MILSDCHSLSEEESDFPLEDSVLTLIALEKIEFITMLRMIMLKRSWMLK